MRPDSHTQLPWYLTSEICLCPLLFCFFFVSWRLFFTSISCTVVVSYLYGEYVVRFFLPNGVSLPCDHGLGFEHQFMREFNSINEPKIHICSTCASLRSICLLYVCIYGHTYSKSTDQPGKVANPARVSWTGNFPVPVRAWEFCLARWVRQCRPASACSSRYSGWIWCSLTRFLPSSAAASIYIFKISIRHRASPEVIGSRNCVPMAFTAESPPAQGQ